MYFTISKSFIKVCSLISGGHLDNMEQQKQHQTFFQNFAVFEWLFSP